MQRTLALLLLAGAAHAQDGFTWHTDLEKARAIAARDNKPMLAVFR